MFEINDIVSTIDYGIDTSRKKHILGGILMSFSLLFGGLAFTAFTLKNDIYKKEEYIDEV